MFSIPPLPPEQPPWGQFQVWWQQVKLAIETNETSQNTLLAQIIAAQTAATAAQATATTAQTTASANMPDVPTASIACDSAGTPNTGQLPKNIGVKRYNGTTDVTAAAAWSQATFSGTITCTVGAATGVLNITAMASNSAVVTVTSVHNGITLSRKVTINKALAAAATTGTGGGTSSSTSTFNAINSSTHADISGTLTVTVGSVGTVTLSAPLYVDTANSGTAANYPVFGKWQWDSTGAGAWTDLATEVQSNPDCAIVAEGAGVYSEYSGTLTCSASKTGLAAASSQKFRLVARNGSGTRSMTFSGTASGVGS